MKPTITSFLSISIASMVSMLCLSACGGADDGKPASAPADASQYQIIAGYCGIKAPASVGAPEGWSATTALDRPIYLASSIISAADYSIAALAMIAALRPDIAFLDIHMPGLTGLQVSHALNTSTRVVFFHVR